MIASISIFLKIPGLLLFFLAGERHFFEIFGPIFSDFCVVSESELALLFGIGVFEGVSFAGSEFFLWQFVRSRGVFGGLGNLVSCTSVFTCGIVPVWFGWRSDSLTATSCKIFSGTSFGGQVSFQS